MSAQPPTLTVVHELTKQDAINEREQLYLHVCALLFELEMNGSGDCYVARQARRFLQDRGIMPGDVPGVINRGLTGRGT